ncbi:hypothetical protein ACHAWF_017481 [Thalassiosira exigua]
MDPSPSFSSATTDLSSHPQRRLAIALPPGPLGWSISRRSTDGECVVSQTSSSTSKSPLLEDGDVIWSLNGIRLASVEGGLAAWFALFEALGRIGARNLVVLRTTNEGVAAVVGAPVTTKGNALALANDSSASAPAASVPTTDNASNGGGSKGREVILTINKPSKDTKLGLTVTQEKGGNTIKVTSMMADSLFVHTQLKVGMMLRTVNGRSCDSFGEGFDVLKSTAGEVTIVASDPPAARSADPVLADVPTSVPTATTSAANAPSFTTPIAPTSNAAARVAIQKENTTPVALNERARSEPTNGNAVPTQPMAKKPRIAVGARSSYSNRDIESIVAAAKLENVQAAIVNVWVPARAIKSNKPLEDFLTVYDCTSCCFLCKRRFRHGSHHLEILSSGDVALCSSCKNKNEKFTLTEVTEYFGISKGDAKKLSHSVGISGWGGPKYSFSNYTVVDAIRSDSSLQHKVRKEAFFPRNYVTIKFTKERFDEAGTSEGKCEILKKAISNVPEGRLREFAVKSLKKVRKGEVGHYLAKL